MKNNFFIGIALGLLAPLAAWLISDFTTLQAQLFPSKTIAFYLIALTINLIAIRYFYRKDRDLEKLAKGILFISFLSMLFMFYCYNR